MESHSPIRTKRDKEKGCWGGVVSRARQRDSFSSCPPVSFILTVCVCVFQAFGHTYLQGTMRVGFYSAHNLNEQFARPDKGFVREISQLLISTRNQMRLEERQAYQRSVFEPSFLHLLLVVFCLGHFPWQLVQKYLCERTLNGQLRFFQRHRRRWRC